MKLENLRTRTKFAKDTLERYMDNIKLLVEELLPEEKEATKASIKEQLQELKDRYDNLESELRTTETYTNAKAAHEQAAKAYKAAKAALKEHRQLNNTPSKEPLISLSDALATKAANLKHIGTEVFFCPAYSLKPIKGSITSIYIDKRKNLVYFRLKSRKNNKFYQVVTHRLNVDRCKVTNKNNQ